MGSGGSIPSTPDIIGEHQSSVDPHDQRSPRLVNEQNDLPLCLIHSRVIEFYCNQCDLDLCSKCIVSIHKGHDFILIEEKNLHKKTDKEQNQDSKEEKDERQRKKSIPNKISSQGGSFSSHSHPHLSSYNFQQYPNQDPKSLATSASSRGGGAAAGTSKPVSRQGSNLNLNLITFPPPPSKSDNVSTSSKSSSSSKTIPFPFYGMSMRLLKALYQYVKSIDPNDQMTTLDVSEQIIKPWTEKYHCSLAELFLTDYMFQPHEVLKLNASQSVSTHPTVFVSHAWRYKFSELISAISSFDRSHQKDLPLFGAGAVAGSAEDEEQDFQVIHDPKSLDLSLTGGGGGNGSDFAEQSNSYWIDVCVNNQWEAPKLPYEWWSSTFLTAIGKIGHTCLVLSPWDDPIPLKRAWCLWEIVCTKTTHSQFTVQFSPSERIKFQHVLRMNFEYIMKAISCIDLESSEAWNPADREMIFDVVRRLDGGFQAVNMILFDVLREWLSESGKDAIDFSENIYYYDSYEKMKNNLYLMNNVGQLMKEQGKYEEAEHLYRLALSGYHRIDWKRYEKEKKERKMREREEKRERRKERKVSQGEEGEEGEGEGEEGVGEEEGEEGDDDEEEEQDHHLSTTNNLAILLNITGRRSEAEILFKEILQAYIRRYGDEDKDTLAIKNNLANIYNDKGDRNLASAMYEEVLGGYLKILGKSNPETLSCMHNLATVWNDQGKTVEAEELMREVQDFIT
jgi:tetratricopeptide (TPR) repeat protein